MNHLLQSKQWRQVKENLGNRTYSVGEYFFQTTKIPVLNKFIGYMPRADLDKVDWKLLYSEAMKVGCIYVSLDPESRKSEVGSQDLIKRLPASSPLADRLQKGVATQMQGNTILDLTKPEEELLKNMKQKHRYNVNLSQKKGVQVKIDDTEESLETMLKLHEETVARQKYQDRSSEYIRTVWKTVNSYQSSVISEQNAKCYVATAYYSESPEDRAQTSEEDSNLKLQTSNLKPVALSSWFLVTHGDTVHYLYGGSSDQFTNVMGTYALVWEIIKWAKSRGFQKLDFMGIEEDLSDGFSRFKAGFGGEIFKYEDTVDLVIDPLLYSLIKLLLKFRK
jgi:lipid II:glycine glycyltransferase (peptidoglycan interpeptide bridge formation enzyme)